MKKLFSIFAMFSLAVGFTACEDISSDIDQPVDDTKDPVVVLTADKQEITADGTDCVTFTATVDGVSVSSNLQIINLNDNTVLEGTTFSTKNAGEYRFMAAYKTNFTSEVVTVVAKSIADDDTGGSGENKDENEDENDDQKDPDNDEGTEGDDDNKDGDDEDNTGDDDLTDGKVVLTADKVELVADGYDIVTFEVTVDGEDKSAEAKIIVLNTNTELEGNIFATLEPDTYTFEAIYDGVKSEQVVITAVMPVQKSLKLTVSKIRIKANGTDTTKLAAYYGEDDVTAECTFRTVKGDVLEGNIFSTTEIGTYNIYALYDNTRSNTVSVDAYDPNISYPYEIGQIYDLNGTKGVAYAIKEDNQGNTWAYFFSLDEEYLQWSTENVFCNCTTEKGALNTYDPFDPKYSRADGGVRDINNYPAFKWCMDHGDDWFLPSSTELRWMWDAITNGAHRFDCDTVEYYNNLLQTNGGDPFIETYYSSSNETDADLVELIAFMADSVVCLESKKLDKYSVRAAYRMQLNE